MSEDERKKEGAKNFEKEKKRAFDVLSAAKEGDIASLEDLIEEFSLESARTMEPNECSIVALDSHKCMPT